MDWTNERVEELRRLWGQGQTASRIAELLGGITRNAVIGKAHRLGLRGRPSPIRRDENAPLIRAPRQTHSHPLAPEPRVEPAPMPAAEVPVAPPSSAPAPQAKAPQAGGRSCSWPVGDPKQPGFHFCGQEAVVGRPYCAAHCSLAYQRKSEAAA